MRAALQAGNTSFTAVGSAYRGQLNWSLISRIMRAQWEKAMASCCLGIVLQHRYESNAQVCVCVCMGAPAHVRACSSIHR